MASNLILAIVVLGLILLGSFVLFAVGIREMRKALKAPPIKKIFQFGLALGLAAPFLLIALLLVWFTVDNFPFTSGIIAHEFAPSGEEICIVQTFKDVEPYQVSLYARRPGQPWVWNYLAHQDDRWRNCHVEFDGDALRVYTGSVLRKTFSLADATKLPDNSEYQLPAEFAPQQILARHN